MTAAICFLVYLNSHVVIETSNILWPTSIQNGALFMLDHNCHGQVIDSPVSRVVDMMSPRFNTFIPVIVSRLIKFSLLDLFSCNPVDR